MPKPVLGLILGAVLGFVDALPAALTLVVLLLAARGYATASGAAFAVSGFTPVASPISAIAPR